MNIKNLVFRIFWPELKRVERLKCLKIWNTANQQVEALFELEKSIAERLFLKLTVFLETTSFDWERENTTCDITEFSQFISRLKKEVEVIRKKFTAETKNPKLSDQKHILQIHSIFETLEEVFASIQTLEISLNHTQEISKNYSTSLDIPSLKKEIKQSLSETLTRVEQVLNWIHPSEFYFNIFSVLYYPLFYKWLVAIYFSLNPKGALGTEEKRFLLQWEFLKLYNIISNTLANSPNKKNLQIDSIIDFYQSFESLQKLAGNSLAKFCLQIVDYKEGSNENEKYISKIIAAGLKQGGKMTIHPSFIYTISPYLPQERKQKIIEKVFYLVNEKIQKIIQKQWINYLRTLKPVVNHYSSNQLRLRKVIKSYLKIKTHLLTVNGTDFSKSSQSQKIIQEKLAHEDSTVFATNLDRRREILFWKRGGLATVRTHIPWEYFQFDPKQIGKVHRYLGFLKRTLGTQWDKKLCQSNFDNINFSNFQQIIDEIVEEWMFLFQKESESIFQSLAKTLEKIAHENSKEFKSFCTDFLLDIFSSIDEMENGHSLPIKQQFQELFKQHGLQLISPVVGDFVDFEQHAIVSNETKDLVEGDLIVSKVICHGLINTMDNRVFKKSEIVVRRQL